jgi:hypothetical protein
MTTPDQYFIYIGGVIVGLLLIGWYWRVVHDIAKRNRYMKAQITLLAKIAEKSGVTPDEIDGILQTTKDQPII